MAKISAHIPASGDVQERNIGEEVFVIRDEMGPWNTSQMMCSKAIESNYKHLDIAAPMNSYPVANYTGFIPVPAANIDGYINQFVAHHSRNVAYAGLERGHLSASITVFTCGLQLFDTLHVHEHCLHVHGLPSGITSLKPLQTITLDKDTAFVCPDLKNIEDVGTEGKKLAISSVYTQSIAKGVFVAFNGSRSSADLNQQRSQEFLNELKKKCPVSFYGRFQMQLSRKLKLSNQNISGDFTTKWHVIEECLYEAVSDLEGVARLDNYLKLGHKKFTGSTLELLIHDIDREVDSFQGTWEKTKDPGPHHYCLKAKYELVYEIVNSLGDKYSQLNECVKKEMASLYFDHKNIKEIADLQAHLLEKLEAKSIANQYNKDIIQVGNTIKTNAAKVTVPAK